MLLLGRGACGFLGIGLMDGSSSILKINICIQKLKVRRDILSPCGLPRPSLKFLEERPLSKSIQAVLFLPIRESQPQNVGLKPKNFNTLSRKLWDKVSKALAMSTATTAPLILFCLQWEIVSQTLINTSYVYLLLLKPF